MSLSLCNNIKPFDLSALYTTICYAWWIYFSTDCRHTKQVNVNDIQYPTLMEIPSSTKVSTRVNMVRVCKDQSLTWTLLTIFKKMAELFCFKIHSLQGSKYYGYGFNKPWISGSLHHEEGVKIPWVGGPNTMRRELDIPWVGGSKYHG